jgi:hypothetical protein
MGREVLRSLRLRLLQLRLSAVFRFQTTNVLLLSGMLFLSLGLPNQYSIVVSFTLSKTTMLLTKPVLREYCCHDFMTRRAQNRYMLICNYKTDHFRGNKSGSRADVQSHQSARHFALRRTEAQAQILVIVPTNNIQNQVRCST